MDKQKDFEKGWEEYKEKCKQEIDEMRNVCGGAFLSVELDTIKTLHKAGYRKIPENAVVLDKDFCDQREEMIVDLQYDKFELMNEISEKDNKIALLEETIECIKFNVDFTRKETAEKFARRLKEMLHYDIIPESGITDEKNVFECIDEICKEITGTYEPSE